MVITPNSSRFITGRRAGQNLLLSVVQNPDVVGGLGGTSVDLDITYTTAAGATVANNFILTPVYEDCTIVNNSPSVISLDDSGNAVLLTDGTASITATYPMVGSQTYTQQMVNGVSNATTGVSSYATGSLRKYLYDQTTALLTAVNALGSNPGSNAINQQYANYSAQSATLLTGITAAGWSPFDATIVANNNTSLTAQAWISPHHWISGIGRAHGVSGISGSTCCVGLDIVVGYSASTYGGTLAKFLPTNWRTYLPEHSGNLPVSGITCFAKMSNTYNGSSNWIEPINAYNQGTSARVKAPDTNALFSPFCKTTGGVIGTGGDSGSPVFCGVNGAAVLLGRMFSYGGGIDWYGNYLTAASALIPGLYTPSNILQNDITSAMNKLAELNGDATVYSLQYVNLSGFTAY